jgi:8-oxo-dGTP pyrophosphatase MutT (NUDIX family)
MWQSWPIREADSMLCDDNLRERITANLAAFQPVVAQADDVHHAAVAVMVTDAGYGADLPGLPAYPTWQPEPALMLTRRSAMLRSHPGQWAFPGGRLDPGETALQTALREMHEEIAVALSPDAVLGRLDDFVTRSGFVMSPFVIWGGPRLETWANPQEVASVHRIPLTEFLREDAPHLDPADNGGHPILRMPVGNDHIAAPTAAIIYQFREVCLLGRPTRVSHFEQPQFAWR